ncbi:hypothetical protein [Salinisphaera sp. G21_0]|uniref:hypothetical protein n=1 Tax=Salinisphaera sp. G21_0 TaxID=2821094 RepID=UPI001AD9FB48|nr:hypothetical protein [Salinisphaera sp. G21_0]MBO9483779.1 hypothetical protein [Salinisphaera sp. G21_0]
MDNLIRDDGKIRQCPSNLAKLGYWKSYRLFFGYKEALSEFCFEELLEALVNVIAAFAYLLIFPVAPFLRCFFSVRRAKQEVKAEQERAT